MGRNGFAMGCNGLQWVAMGCDGLQWVAMGSISLQWVAMGCNGCGGPRQSLFTRKFRMLLDLAGGEGVARGAWPIHGKDDCDDDGDDDDDDDDDLVDDGRHT